MKMKKATAITAVVLSAVSAFSEPAYMPQTSLEQITESPLKLGEIAWAENADGSASIYVGSKTATPMLATDPTALRGSRTEELDPSKYAVTCDDNVVYDGNGWKCTWAYGSPLTNRLYVVVPKDCIIDSVKYEFATTGGNVGGLHPSFHESRTANEMTLAISCGEIGTCTVKNLKVNVKRAGECDGKTDLTKVKYTLTDAIGEFDFADLRNWARNYHLGNLGVDWSKYPAVHGVAMEDNALRFGENYVWAMGPQTNLTLTTLGKSIMDVHGNGVRSTNDFKLVSVKSSMSNYVFVVFENRIPNFDEDRLVVEYCDNLDSGLGNFASLVRNRDWGLDIVFANSMVTTNTITVFPTAFKNKSHGFLRIHYMTQVTDPFRVEFNVPVYARGGLYVVGNDRIAREVQTKLTAGAGIAIENGVISATGGGGPEISVTNQPIPYNEGGVAFAYSATGTLAFTGDWPKGKPIYLSGTLASGASIAADVRILGYDSIPVDTPVQCVAWKSGATWFVNVISGL